MANQIRIKRRAAGGAVGAPSTLLNGELAYNESDDILYYGFGAGAGGTATAIKSIAGVGAYIDKVSDQTIGGNKTFSNTITGSISGNAGTATKWLTARNLSLTGDASATFASVDGSANVSASLTLAASGVTAGSYGSASSVGVFTVDAKGRITSATATAIAIAAAQVSGLAASATTDTTNATNITSGTLSAARLPTSGVTAGTYNGSATQNIPLTFDVYGRLTAVGAPVTITPAFADITNKPTTLSGYGITDAYTKTEVDGLVQGLDPKQSVKAATTANITLSGAQTIDGVSVVAGDRVLVKDQTSPAQNGIYIVASGAWIRATDMDSWTEVPSAFVFVEQGSTNADVGYVCTSDQGGTLGTTAITFVTFNGAANIIAGTGLAKSGNTLSIANTGVATGTYGSASTVGTFTVNAQGQLTAASNAAIAISAAQVTSGTLDAARLADSGVTAGTYGSASQVSQVTFDAKGRATSATSVDIVIDCGQF